MSPEDIAQAFQLPSPPVMKPRYNVAPSQLVAVIGLKPDGKTRGLAMLKWGFVPYWANSSDEGPKPINARAETVWMKPPFDHSFREKRCLIPADGFYVWASSGKKKVPHLFRLKSGGLMAFAGLWDVWRGEGKPNILSCAIITVAANEVVRPFHDRMPAVLRPEDYDLWLGHDSEEKKLLGALQPLPAERLKVVKVGTAVNRVTNDSPACVAPAA